jgi:hypothetical protein
MMRPGGNHIDRQRRLLPRAYLKDPHMFGVDPTARVVVPPGGDRRSAEVARVQHHLAMAWRRHSGPRSAALLGERFGFSKQTLSRSLLGQRWMGEAVMAAIIEAINKAAAVAENTQGRAASRH